MQSTSPETAAQEDRLPLWIITVSTPRTSGRNAPSLRPAAIISRFSASMTLKFPAKQHFQRTVCAFFLWGDWCMLRNSWPPLRECRTLHSSLWLYPAKRWDCLFSPGLVQAFLHARRGSWYTQVSVNWRTLQRRWQWGPNMEEEFYLQSVAANHRRAAPKPSKTLNCIIQQNYLSKKSFGNDVRMNILFTNS